MTLLRDVDRAVKLRYGNARLRRTVVRQRYMHRKQFANNKACECRQN